MDENPIVSLVQRYLDAGIYVYVFSRESETVPAKILLDTGIDITDEEYSAITERWPAIVRDDDNGKVTG